MFGTYEFWYQRLVQMPVWFGDFTGAMEGPHIKRKERGPADGQCSKTCNSIPGRLNLQLTFFQSVTKDGVK